MLSNAVSTNYMWLFKFKLVKIKQNKKLISLVSLITFQMFISQTYMVATILAIDIENV